MHKSILRGIGLLLTTAFLVSGCAHNGKIENWVKYQDLAAASPARASVTIEKPTVVDKDEENDFRDKAAVYAASMQDFQIKVATENGYFTRCTATPSPDAYRLSSSVVITNHREPKGGAVTIALGGFLLPPLLGLAWSFPVGLGNTQATYTWKLTAPSGEVMATKTYEHDGVPYFFPSWEFAKFLKPAAVAVAAHKQQAKTRPIAARKPSPRPAPRRPATTATATNKRTNVIVAVFDIKDSSNKLSRSTIDQLTEYLATMLTQTAGYKVVPRDQLRKRLTQEKKKSYRECYDQTCQIELGKAVAAQKSLATKIIQVGSKCAITANLYNLKTETSEQAAAAETNCTDEALLGAVKNIVKKLASN